MQSSLGLSISNQLARHSASSPIEQNMPVIPNNNWQIGSSFGLLCKQQKEMGPSAPKRSNKSGEPNQHRRQVQEVMFLLRSKDKIPRLNMTLQDQLTWTGRQYQNIVNDNDVPNDILRQPSPLALMMERQQNMAEQNSPLIQKQVSTEREAVNGQEYTNSPGIHMQLVQVIMKIIKLIKYVGTIYITGQKPSTRWYSWWTVKGIFPARWNWPSYNK